MKKSLVTLLVVAGAILLIVVSLTGRYNRLITLEEGVTAAWSQVENVYQRRADLIPNLVNTVKGYADFEQKTLTQVIEARAKATSVTIDPTNMTEANMQQFQQAQDGLGSALSRLMVVIERYPDLKANQNFMDLQAQLEGTENRITVERRAFNETAQAYNTQIRRFPNNILAGIFGFDKKAYFQAESGAEQAPEVQF
ncbi:LemA family protein [Lentimicrobium sp.]|jgi:LemA protein|uniref:LemA family protein n=1 Tax=Lentimicrobium sp. TaxID=2034841 RepID=UPI0025CDFA49|nr:LemA family protein [Lentimicrobium sp.]MCO5256141.1 LemA family protein [Lentimicrobium sp.]MCO5263841.1 LemA family protein [Lentimicrobium sp.]HOP13404.1 LemA family protein [Lentimicrobium sp.]HPF65816.1 LemA family protein [Lentimicrobium sp.]HPJ63535.1 LemA family protein [Lentimicrobium sp.]